MDADETKAQLDGIEKSVTELRDTLGERFKATDKWISEVQAGVNTARSHDAGGDALKNAIPDNLRPQIEVAEMMGIKDPVKSIAMGSWFQGRICGAAATIKGQNPELWHRQREAIEKAWGYNHQAYVAVLKASIGEVAGGGANIIATPVEAEIYRLIRDNAVVRPLAHRIIMTSLTHQLPQENANLQSFIIAEAGLVTDAYSGVTTGFSQIALTARKFGSIATLSSELLNDNIVGLAEYILTAIGEDIGILEDRAATESLAAGVNFTGIDAASGVNSFSCTGNTSGGDSPTYGDLVKAAFLATQRASRQNATWIMNPKVFRQVCSLIDTNGQPIVHFGNVPNALPDRLLGYPVAVCSGLVRTNAIKSGSLSAYYGPMSKLVFGDLRGIEMLLDPYSLITTDMVRARVLKRTGIVCPVGSAFTIVRGISIT